MIRLDSVDELDFGRYLRAGDGVAWGQACAEPRTLVEHLLAHPPGARVRAFIGTPVTDTLRASQAQALDLTSYTAAGTNAALHADGLLEILPVHYSQLPALARAGRIRADLVLVQLSPPDAEGRYSLGLTRDYLADLLPHARHIIGEVNPQVPWTFGGPQLTEADMAALVPARFPPAAYQAPVPSPVRQRIARHAADLVPDGATLQFGIGAMTEAVTAALGGHRDLGVHSGLLPDGLVELMERGAVTGARKRIDRGLVVGGMLMGGRRLFDYAHRNPRIHLREVGYTNAPDILAMHERLVALNSALEVDLTGQINAEAVGGRYLGSVGGAVEFARAAHRSRGGIPIVMLPSRAGGSSRIVARLSGPVTIARSDAGVVVTEHGIADLRGLTLAQRVERMIAIADPELRADLDGAADTALAAAPGETP